MSIIIRRAQPQDVHDLCRLYHAFHQFHVAGLPSRLATLGDFAAFDCAELVTQLGAIMANPEAAIFVADHEAELVGFAEIYLRQDEPNTAVVSHKYGHLQSLMVQQAYRGQVKEI